MVADLVWQHSLAHRIHCMWYGDLTHDGLSELAVVSTGGIHILQVSSLQASQCQLQLNFTKSRIHKICHTLHNLRTQPPFVAISPAAHLLLFRMYEDLCYIAWCVCIEWLSSCVAQHGAGQKIGDRETGAFSGSRRRWQI